MGTGWSSGIQSYSGDRGKISRQLFARREDTTNDILKKETYREKEKK